VKAVFGGRTVVGKIQSDVSKRVVYILKHELVPKHILLTREEAEEVCRKYKAHPYQLPHIKASDPIVIAIGARPGDVIKIIRKSPTAGIEIAYRYVVEE
jgi:DNA-directed RNA polymerase subunit H